VGELPLGPPPTTLALDCDDLALGPADARDLHVLALIGAGESSRSTAIGADRAFDTLLGESTWLSAGEPRANPFPVNFMIRLLLDGDRATLEGAREGATASEGAMLREVGREIAIDRWGRRIE